MPDVLTPIISQFLSNRKRKSERRQIWTNRLKSLLQDNLVFLAKLYPDVGWHVNTSGTENYESIYIAINNIPSGIKDAQGNILMEHGAALFFSQSPRSGRIIIWMQYSKVDGVIIPVSPSEDIEIIEPEDLFDSEKIENYLLIFFKKQLDIAIEERRPIGF